MDLSVWSFHQSFFSSASCQGQSRLLPASVTTSNDNKFVDKAHQPPRNTEDIGRHSHSGSSPSSERQLQNILVLMITLHLDVLGEPEVGSGGLRWEGVVERGS
jgi:hypothetical protein